MRLRIFAVLAFAAVAACGADGAPEPVEGGIRISGTASIGVSGSF